MISGRRSLVRGRVTEPGEFLELSAESLRSLVAKDAELSEIFMRAFILRRLELIRTGQGNVILMASRHSANALRLREFLTRNEHPYTYIDLDTDKTSQELLDRFDVKLDEIPVVICSARSVLRNPSGRVPGAEQRDRRGAGPRFDHCGRWTVRLGSCRLRRFGRPRRAGD